MNKKILAFIVIFSLFFVENISAQIVELRPPTLEETLRQNEENAIKNANSIIVTKNPTVKEIDLTYRKIHSGSAITLYRANEAMLWVQEIDLSRGASVDSVLEVVSYNSETGEPQYKKKNITDTLSSLEKQPFSLINGQFFNPRTQPSELSFGLKQGDIIRTAGADNRNSRKNILKINGETAQIVPHSWENLRDAEGNFAMVNLTMANRSYPTENIGRTYMCLKNPDKNNTSSIILTFVATDMTENLIEREILKHGCKVNSTSQLDSSGSSRMWFDGNYIFGAAHKGEPDRRIIPHSIVFYDAK